MNKQEKALEILKGLELTTGNSNILKEPLQLAISALQQQLNNGWIPVSERLPEDLEKVYATVIYLPNDYIYSDRVTWYLDKFWWRNGKRISNKYKVIAWKPDMLPEPYKEVSND